MFRGRLEWHSEVGLDRLWSEYRPDDGETVGPAAAIAEDAFYAGVSGWTRDGSDLHSNHGFCIQNDGFCIQNGDLNLQISKGSPLMLERLGCCDLAGIARGAFLFSIEDLISYGRTLTSY